MNESKTLLTSTRWKKIININNLTEVEVRIVDIMFSLFKLNDNLTEEELNQEFLIINNYEARPGNDLRVRISLYEIEEYYLFLTGKEFD